MGYIPYTRYHEQDESGGCEHPGDIAGLRMNDQYPGSTNPQDHRSRYLIVDIEILC